MTDKRIEFLEKLKDIMEEYDAAFRLDGYDNITSIIIEIRDEYDMDWIERNITAKNIQRYINNMLIANSLE